MTAIFSGRLYFCAMTSISTGQKDEQRLRRKENVTTESKNPGATRISLVPLFASYDQYPNHSEKERDDSSSALNEDDGI